MKIAKKQAKRARAEAVQRFFERYFNQPEEHIREGDQFGFHKHLDRINVEEKRAFHS